jgi:hypothetical protein
MNDDIVWGDPPPRPIRGAGRWGAVPKFLTELSEHPGKWALYPSSGSRTHIQGIAFRMGLRVEMRHVGQGTPESRLYVRVIEDGAA